MLESPLWNLLSDFLGIGAVAMLGVIGYFIKRTLDDYEERRNKLEAKLDRYFAQVRSEIDEVERVSLRAEGEMNKELRALHDTFVPRLELNALVQGIRDAVAQNTKTSDQQSEKLDKILMILAEGKNQ